MSWATALLEHAVVYRFWQAPFADKKLEPVFRHNDMTKVHQVLDVGCGPGTNTHHFTETGYLGIDLNERYIESARRLYEREFVVADVLHYSAECTRRFDFILVNSILHHVDTPSAMQLLLHLEKLLTEDGHIHVLELVQPGQRGIARLLARWDRGECARPLTDWLQIFSAVFDTVVFEPYSLKALRTVLWNMVYFKGRAKR